MVGGGWPPAGFPPAKKREKKELEKL